MPGEDGYALIRGLRQREAPLRRIPAIALTAHARASDAQAARRAGFDDHLVKPTTPAKLAARIAELHGARRREAAVS
jgi:CheY-like chemotaxis protein